MLSWGTLGAPSAQAHDAAHPGPERQQLPHILGPAGSGQDGQDLHQLLVVQVVNKGADGHGVLRLKHVRVRGVVHDDDVLQFATEAFQVLDVVALKGCARLAEQAVLDVPQLVHLVHQRVRVLAQARGEYHHLKDGCNARHKLLEEGALLHVHVDALAIDFHGDDVVCVRDRLEGAVHQRLVQIQHERLLAVVRGVQRRQHRLAHPAGVLGYGWKACHGAHRLALGGASAEVAVRVHAGCQTAKQVAELAPPAKGAAVGSAHGVRAVHRVWPPDCLRSVGACHLRDHALLLAGLRFRGYPNVKLLAVRQLERCHLSGAVAQFAHL
mmetsp:Transcript_12475/g.31418  ORF Transcript_12475/g.31418 Transcript_12475/m.31418 type:complete len:325 (+) Transcript_12475:207-1181(+)